MFTADDADRVLARLLGLAEAGPAIAGAAMTGSRATGASDAWSDIDLAFGVTGPLDPVMERWTQRLYRDFAAVHDWDLQAGPAIYRVFLLPGWLEVDIAFVPEADFGPLGPSWRTRAAGANLRSAGWHYESWNDQGRRDRTRSWSARRWAGTGSRWPSFWSGTGARRCSSPGGCSARRTWRTTPCRRRRSRR